MKDRSCTRVRFAASTDIEAIAEIQVAGWKTAYAGVLPDSVLEAQSVQKRMQTWSQLLKTKVGNLWVAEGENKVIGFCHTQIGRDTPQWGEITALYVCPQSWSRGAGTLLLEKALAMLREQGFPRAFLWVLTDNPRARAFYESCGLLFDTNQKWVDFGGTKIEELRYSIKL